jgi:hypothetical protein
MRLAGVAGLVGAALGIAGGFAVDILETPGTASSAAEITYLSAFEPAPTLDQGEGRAPSAGLGQLGLGLAA